MATQRRLHLVRLLLRGPASADTLIEELRTSLGNDIYPAEARTALRHDLIALRETFGCEFVYRTGEGYFLTNLGTLTLLDLNTEELEALSLLFNSIAEGALPHTQQLSRLRTRVLALLPEENRKQLPRIAPNLRLDLPLHTSGEIDAVIARLRPTLGRCEVSFQYRSPYTPADTLEFHRVAPYGFLQRDGMTYLDAYCLGSSLTKLARRTILYRLDRIVPRSLRRLPQQLPPIRYAYRSYQLRYRLSPEIAGRRDVPLWFQESTCQYQEDGSVLVEATITDLWHARQILLRYREHCQVLEPPELVTLIRDSIQRMAEIYRMPEETPHE